MKTSVFIFASSLALVGCSKTETDYSAQSDTGFTNTISRYASTNTGNSATAPIDPSTAQNRLRQASEPGEKRPSTAPSDEQPVASPALTPPSNDPAVAANADDAVSQRIRKAIMNDQTLATGANDVQVTTINGTLTLRGTVPSEELKKSIEAKAQLAAGIARVDNQLQVKN